MGIVEAPPRQRRPARAAMHKKSSLHLQYAPCMTTPLSLDDLAPRVEALLAHHEQLQQAHRQLQEQLATLTQERDSLRLRLQAARARIDALIVQLPANQPPHQEQA